MQFEAYSVCMVKYHIDPNYFAGCRAHNNVVNNILLCFVSGCDPPHWFGHFKIIIESNNRPTSVMV